MTMWRDKPKEEKQANLNAHKGARQAAEQMSKVFRDQNAATIEANALVIETEKHVPWWRR